MKTATEEKPKNLEDGLDEAASQDDINSKAKKNGKKEDETQKGKNGAAKNGTVIPPLVEQTIRPTFKLTIKDNARLKRFCADNYTKIDVTLTKWVLERLKKEGY